MRRLRSLTLPPRHRPVSVGRTSAAGSTRQPITIPSNFGGSVSVRSGGSIPVSVKGNNYLFGSGCLVRALRGAHKQGETDFGGHVLPRMLKTHRVFAYDFASNEIPGLKPSK
jgi:hypothetical protein